MQKEIIINEITYKAVRSSGAGGQHVNKVASKITAFFDLRNSQGLSEGEKNRLLKKLESRLSKEGIIQINAEESRSQHRNKALATERLINLLTEGLLRPKVRRATKPTKGSKLRKLKSKAKQSEKKSRRQKPNMD